MGMGNRDNYLGGNKDTVYYDADKGQYYTMTNFNPVTGLGGYNLFKQYIGEPLDQNKPSQVVTDMIARANAASQRINTPTLASLFPNMGMPTQSFTPTTNPLVGNMTGQFGAGRFLGQGASQFGNPAMPMGGFAGMMGINSNNQT